MTKNGEIQVKNTIGNSSMFVMNPLTNTIIITVFHKNRDYRCATSRFSFDRRKIVGITAL